MMTIYKYEIPISQFFELEMPWGAKILDFQLQKCKPVIWALVDTLHAKQSKRFGVFGTGNELNPNFSYSEYYGTIQESDDSLVWHLFGIN